MSQELKDQFGQFDFTNDSDRGANNLIEFLKYSPNVRALINVVIPEIQQLNDEQQTVYSQINIFEAVGTQLDDIFGTLLNLERGSTQTDESYRSDLLAQATVLSRSGEIVVMKNLYRNLVVATRVSLIEYYPHFFIMNAEMATPAPVSDSIKNTVNNSKLGGVGIALTVSQDTRAFSFSSLPEGSGNPLLGWSSLADPTSGGVMGSLA